MQVEPRNDAIGGLAVVAAAVVVITRMQRHVDVADEMDEESQRFQPHRVGQAFVGENALVALDLRAHAGTTRTVLARIIGLGDRLGLIVPGEGIAPAPVLPAQAVGPDRGIREAGERAIGRPQLRRSREQARNPGPRGGPDIGQRDIGGDGVGIKTPRLRLRRQHQRGERGERGEQAQPTVSYCSITHSSCSDALIQACIHSCSHSASI